MGQTETADRLSGERALIAVLRGLLDELGQTPGRVALDSDLERTLGLGSLERAEFITRVESRFGCRLPDKVLTEARTPGDVLAALQSSEDVESARPQAEDRSEEQAAARDDRAARWKIPSESEASTLVDLLRFRAELDGAATHIHLLEEQGVRDISYQELWRKALDVSSGLAERGVRPGDRVSLVLPTSQDFFFSFLGILCAGAVPVPIYPPIRMDQLGPYLERHGRILSNAGAVVIISEPGPLMTVSKVLRDRVPTLNHAVTVEDLGEAERGAGPAPVRPDDLGLIQYTSGSTGDPKGVSLRHRNLLANMRAIGQNLALNPRDVCVSWLPLYHDMGLIGAWLTALLHATPLAIMSPLSFLTRPERWLWAFHNYGGSISPAPNFGYELTLRKVKDDVIDGLDLSTWRVAMNGAEPINPDTLKRFRERFEPYGFSPGAMMPVYGMAETCVALTFPPLDRGPVVDTVARETFLKDRKAVPVESEDDAGLSFVCCGAGIVGHEFKIVPADEPGGEPLDDRHEGRILFRGPSSMAGYFNRDEATEEIRYGDWFDTGDLGYVADGELFVTGRVKDLVIKGGKNYHPQDIEKAAWTVEGIRKGNVVAFSAPDATTGEAIVVVAETREPANRHEALRTAVSAAVQDFIGTPADRVVLVPPGTIPKTSSGKLRRRETRQQYLDDELLVKRNVWLDMTGIVMASLGSRTIDLIKRAAHTLWGVWALGVGVIGMALTCLVINLFLANKETARAFAKTATRWIFRLMGVRIRREGGPVPEGPCLVISNHSSYWDPLLLLATVDEPMSFVAKSTAFDYFLVGRTLTRIGCLPVVRASGASSLKSFDKVREALDAGGRVHVFPEGTFTRVAGLRSFRLGAFQVAAERGLPIVPIGIEGARELYPDRTILPRWSEVVIRVLDPIKTEGTELREIAAVRDRARRELAEAAGEPALDMASAALPVGADV